MISVVIPAYNRENTIERCINSVLAQTYDDIEVIVVDDCSSDSTVDIVESIQDSRIRLERLDKNAGAAVARNRGTQLATGDYIAYQDSDDYWYPNKLSKQLQYLVNSDSDICLCRLKRFGYGVHDDPLVPSRSIRGGVQTYNRVLIGSLFAMPAVLAKSDIAKSTLFDEDLHWHEDYEWSIRLAQNCKVVLLDEVLGEVYLQSNSVSVRNIGYELDFYNHVIEKYPSVFDEYPWFKAMLLNARGNCLSLDGASGHSDYRAAFKVNPTIKAFFKILLSYTPILKMKLKAAEKKGSIK